jgi:hypothetical protein
MKLLALTLALCLLSAESWAQTSAKAREEYERAITGAGYFGAPRSTTVLLPTCNTANKGAVRFDSTTLTLKVCNGTAWGAPGVGASDNTAWSGTNSFIDGSFSIIGSATAGKIAKFEVDPWAGAVTRTFTLPDVDGTVLTTGAAVTFGQGGTGLSSAADDTTLVSSGSAWQAKALPDCTDASGNHINYTASTNAFSCGTSSSVAAGATTALDNLASVAVNSPLGLGGTSNAFPSIEWNTVQTPDTGMLLTGSTSNHWVIAERADKAFDFAHAATTNPFLYVHSAAQSATQWVGLTHNGTNAQIASGFGGLDLQSMTGVGGGGYPTLSVSNLHLYIADRAGVLMQVRIGATGNPAFGGTIQGAPANGVANSKGGVLLLAGGQGAGNSAPPLLKLGAGALPGTASTGTLHTIIDRVIVGASKYLTNNTVTSLANVALASNTVATGSVQYACEVFDGTDLQVEQGAISYMVSNKGGTFANNVTVKYGNQQLATAGTLVVTWTITAANPAVIQVNCNSSLTPSAGYPRVTYEVHNLTQQAVAIL